MCDECDRLATQYLQEFTVKDIKTILDPRDLPHRDYAPLLKNVKLRAIRNNTMKFFVRNNLNGWFSYVRFVEWDAQVKDLSIDATEAARLLLWSGNVQIHCLCPSFAFHGYAYILTQLGAAIVPEVRFPHIRNPKLLGIACKHLRRVIPVLPFYLGDMAAAIKQQRNRLKIG